MINWIELNWISKQPFQLVLIETSKRVASSCDTSMNLCSFDPAPLHPVAMMTNLKPTWFIWALGHWSVKLLVWHCTVTIQFEQELESFRHISFYFSSMYQHLGFNSGCDEMAFKTCDHLSTPFTFYSVSKSKSDILCFLYDFTIFPQQNWTTMAWRVARSNQYILRRSAQSRRRGTTGHLKGAAHLPGDLCVPPPSPLWPLHLY